MSTPGPISNQPPVPPARNNDVPDPIKKERFSYLDLDVTKRICSWSEPLFEKDPTPCSALAYLVCLVAMPLILVVGAIETVVDIVALPLTWIANKTYYLIWGDVPPEAPAPQAPKLPDNWTNQTIGKVASTVENWLPKPLANKAFAFGDYLNSFSVTQWMRGTPASTAKLAQPTAKPTAKPNPTSTGQKPPEKKK